MRKISALVCLVVALGMAETPSSATGRIAFVNDEFQIVAIDADGQNMVQLTDNDGGNYDPVWSPDGRRIAFFSFSNQDGDLEIFVMDADGGNQTQLTFNDNEDQEPVWSPDGRRIAFISNYWCPGSENRDDWDWDISVVDADGENLSQLTNNTANDDDPSWSPDGRRIAFLSDRNGGLDNIFVMDADGRNVTQLTDYPHSIDEELAWSPDGSRIAFISSRDMFLSEIFVMDADGSNQTQLTNNGAAVRQLAWSPDGSHIAFQLPFNDDFEIFLIDSDGQNQRRLTDMGGFLGGSKPVWSPDGNSIVFASCCDGDNELYVIDVDGNNLTKLTDNEGFDSDPAWCPVE